MPNWCFNTLSVDGDASSIAKFREWLNDEPLTLQKIKPMPAELEDTTSPTPKGQEEKAAMLTEKYGASDWYTWHINNWGTKWDIEANEEEGSSDETNIMFWFDSAWAPPTNAIAELGKLFPNLSLRLNYREDGCQFAGVMTVNGDEVFDDYYDANKDEEAYRAFMLEEYDEDPLAEQEEEENE